MPEIVKISELSAAAALTGDELAPIVQDGVTVSTTLDNVADLAADAAAIAAAQAFTATAIYRGNFSNIDCFGFPQLALDVGNATAAGTLTPSGTKGQAIRRIVGDSGANSPGVGVDFYAIGASYYRTASGGGGGFTFDALLMMEAILDTQCVMFGFCDLSNNAMFNLVSNPSEFAYLAAFAKDATDTYLQFMLRSASGTVTKIPLTGVLVSALVNHMLQVHIEATATEVAYRLTDLQTGIVIASGSSSSNMPAADQKLYPHMAMQTKSSGAVTAVQLAFFRMQVSVQP